MAHSETLNELSRDQRSTWSATRDITALYQKTRQASLKSILLSSSPLAAHWPFWAAPACLATRLWYAVSCRCRRQVFS